MAGTAAANTPKKTAHARRVRIGVHPEEVSTRPCQGVKSGLAETKAPLGGLGEWSKMRLFSHCGARHVRRGLNFIHRGFTVVRLANVDDNLQRQRLRFILYKCQPSSHK